MFSPTKVKVTPCVISSSAHFISQDCDSRFNFYSPLSPSSRQVRAAPGRTMLKSTSVSGEIYASERTDGSQSDTALGTVGMGGKKRRSSLSARVVSIVSNRRSRSTSQIIGPGEFKGQNWPSPKWRRRSGWLWFENVALVFWFDLRFTLKDGGRQTFNNWTLQTVKMWHYGLFASSHDMGALRCF